MFRPSAAFTKTKKGPSLCVRQILRSRLYGTAVSLLLSSVGAAAAAFAEAEAPSSTKESFGPPNCISSWVVRTTTCLDVKVGSSITTF